LTVRTLICKKYHQDHGANDVGVNRTAADTKSRCPGWARDPELQRRLLEEALVDDEGGTDSHGSPIRLWNAVNGMYFIGVSSNLPAPSYNCYPEVPATALIDELTLRAERSVEDVLGGGDVA
jgi:hypothetical protein